MDDIVCSSCGELLHIISGGDAVIVVDGVAKITTVQLWGCMNPDCIMQMQEQGRTETPPRDSFQG